MINDRILYEDNHLIIVNKLPGELVQGDETGDRTLADDVKEYLKTAYNKPGMYTSAFLIVSTGRHLESLSIARLIKLFPE